MNQAIIKGRLGQDPELKTVMTDKKVVNFSIATNDGTKDKPKTNWHNCTAWGRTAEVIEKYFKKGDEILVTGSIDYRKPEEVTYTSINVFRFEFCGSNNKPEGVSVEGVDDDLPF
jgi:single-strand DNA-binding protein